MKGTWQLDYYFIHRKKFNFNLHICMEKKAWKKCLASIEEEKQERAAIELIWLCYNYMLFHLYLLIKIKISKIKKITFKRSTFFLYKRYIDSILEEEGNIVKMGLKLIAHWDTIFQLLSCLSFTDLVTYSCNHFLIVAFHSSKSCLVKGKKEIEKIYLVYIQRQSHYGDSGGLSPTSVWFFSFL